MLDEIRILSQAFIAEKYQTYQRYFIKTHPLKHRFTIILGERGIGKTTMIIQYLLSFTKGNQQSNDILYIPADHFLIQPYSLYEIADSFYKMGGKVIAFDEIHKYNNWSSELKSIYDTFPKLRIIASGSSALEIHKGSHDLSRRAIVYQMHGLSFREFMEVNCNLTLQNYTLDEIVSTPDKIAFDIQKGIEDNKILKCFSEYLVSGYYPYFLEFESTDEFKLTVEQNLHTTIESDLVAIYPHLTGNSIRKIKQLIIYIAQSVPFIPNWKTIKQATQIGDDRTLKTYFKYLEDANIIRLVKPGGNKFSTIESQEKVFLANTNQLYAFANLTPNKGTLRETFFVSMLSPNHQVGTAKHCDFIIDDTVSFEVGGKNKDRSQIKSMKNAYLVIDDIETGAGQRIPLWLFGFLY